MASSLDLDEGLGDAVHSAERDPATLSVDQLRQLLAQGVPLDVIQRMAAGRGMPDSGWSPTGYARQWQYPYAGGGNELQAQRGPQRDGGMLDMMGQRNALAQFQDASYAPQQQQSNNLLAQLMQMMGIGR